MVRILQYEREEATSLNKVIIKGYILKVQIEAEKETLTK